MLKRCNYFLLFALSLCVGCQVSPPADTAPEPLAISPEDAVAEVSEVFQAYASEWNSGNLEGVFALLADDIVQMNPDTAYVGKDDLSANWTTIMEKYDDAWTPTIDAIEAADNLVFIKGHFTASYSLKTGGETTTRFGDGVWVFRRDTSGTWKLVLEQWFDRESGA